MVGSLGKHPDVSEVDELPRRIRPPFEGRRAIVRGALFPQRILLVDRPTSGDETEQGPLVRGS